MVTRAASGANQIRQTCRTCRLLTGADAPILWTHLDLASCDGTRMQEKKQLIVTIGFRAKPGMAARLERELRNRVPISRTEAGTLDYRLYRSTQNSDVFFLFSRYLSDKAFDIHLYQPYSLTMLAELEELLADPPRVDTYETVLG
jgi:quinol monooxygenase YgiN